jgi:hypothetical protein
MKTLNTWINWNKCCVRQVKGNFFLKVFSHPVFTVELSKRELIPICVVTSYVIIYELCSPACEAASDIRRNCRAPTCAMEFLPVPQVTYVGTVELLPVLYCGVPTCAASDICWNCRAPTCAASHICM